MGTFKWLYPGMRIKRWVFLCSAGIILCSVGFALTVTEKQATSGSLIVLMGVATVAISIRKIIKSVITVLLPERENEFVNIMYQKRYLERGPKIVVIGGGSGLAVLLHGLKEITSNITAVVTVADDGGSSGRLRNQFGILPPGDIRNCLVALADAEPLMSDLFQFRFKESGELEGHSFGNLFILAMIKVTGDFEKAIKESSKILAIRGRVIPSTLKKVALVAEHKDGTITEGESAIAKVKSAVSRLHLKPSPVAATEDALLAIQNADAVIMGPGSLYTSVIPNLLIEDISLALARVNIPKIYIANMMTQKHETDGHSVSDHVKAIQDHANTSVLSHVIVNNGEISGALLSKYEHEDAHLVQLDTEKIRQMGLVAVEANLVDSSDMVRHNPRRVCKLITDIIGEHKKKQQTSDRRQSPQRDVR